MTKKNLTLKPNSTIGIFGGGQLGKMICFAAHQLGYRTVVFCDTPNSPASFVCNQSIISSYLDEKALKEFADKIDIATFEFENIPAAAVDFICKFKPTYPNSSVLKITQNRLQEKDFVRKIGIATTNYSAINSLEDLKLALENFNFKAILKTATMGYDGKGQVVLNQTSNLEEIWQNTGGKNKDQKLILEKFADFNQEISVICARSINGEIACYQPLTNIHKNGILDKSIYPATISNSTAKKAVEIATKTIKELNLTGILTIEFFVLKNGDLLINELAPRPHNSGHFSINASNTSQFEQLVRAISGMPLGNTDFHSSGFMQNLIGDGVLNADKYLQNPKAKLHLYGKDKIAPGRKMGHVNILD